MSKQNRKRLRRNQTDLLITKGQGLIGVQGIYVGRDSDESLVLKDAFIELDGEKFLIANRPVRVWRSDELSTTEVVT